MYTVSKAVFISKTRPQSKRTLLQSLVHTELGSTQVDGYQHNRQVKLIHRLKGKQTDLKVSTAYRPNAGFVCSRLSKQGLWEDDGSSIRSKHTVKELEEEEEEEEGEEDQLLKRKGYIPVFGHSLLAPLEGNRRNLPGESVYSECV